MTAYTEVFGHEPDLHRMMKGDPVLHLQQLLDQHCYGPESDGYFGDTTEQCLNLFKGGIGMSKDGVVDEATWAVLNAPPRIISRLHGPLSRSGNVLSWSATNTGRPTIPANTVISSCWAYERANTTSITPAYDFGPTTDRSIGTHEQFSIDLLSFFQADGRYTVAVTVGPDADTLDYDIVHGQVV